MHMRNKLCDPRCHLLRITGEGAHPVPAITTEESLVAANGPPYSSSSTRRWTRQRVDDRHRPHFLRRIALDLHRQTCLDDRQYLPCHRPGARRTSEKKQGKKSWSISSHVSRGSHAYIRSYETRTIGNPRSIQSYFPSREREPTGCGIVCNMSFSGRVYRFKKFGWRRKPYVLYY
jgi:hypothetical protein